MRISPLSLLLTWLSHWGLWLIFANNTGVRELGIGAGAAAVATYFVALFLAHTRARFELQGQYLSQAVHVPKMIVHDSWILLRVTAMRLAGKKARSGIVAVPFRAGGGDRQSRGRRALAISFITLTPNTVVLGISREPEALFFHTLVPPAVPEFLIKMGAEVRSGQ